MIGIVDVDLGNLGPLRQALYSLGQQVALISAPSAPDDVSHLLLPGVGAFRAAMGKLAGAGLVEPIREFVKSRRSLLGICLGMQLLATEGDEGGVTPGLALVPGRVVPLAPKAGFRIPHVGWNEIRRARQHPVLQGIRNDGDFYFVHSYQFAADEPADVYAEAEYGEPFSAIVGRANVLGVQFHPEKSQANGLRILDNFCAWSGAC